MAHSLLDGLLAPPQLLNFFWGSGQVEELVLRLEGIGGFARADLVSSGRGRSSDLRAGHRLISASAAEVLRQHRLSSRGLWGSFEEPFEPPRAQRIRLELLVKYVREAGAQDSHGGLFCPTLAQQRLVPRPRGSSWCLADSIV